MLRWRWVLVLWLIGTVMTAYGVYVELKVREAVGGGAYSVFAHMIAGKKIAHYRWLSQACALLGPAVIVGAFLLRRNWGPERELAWLSRQAQRRRSRAGQLRQRSQSVLKEKPKTAQRLTQKAEALDAVAGKLEQKAKRRSRQIEQA